MKLWGCIFFLSLVISTAVGGQFSTFDENGKVGLKDEQGKIVIPPQYDELGWGDGKFSIVDRVTGYRLNGFWGLISIDNHRITKPEFVNLYPGEGLYLIAYKKNNVSMKVVSGCITTTGKDVIPFEYDGVIISSLRAIVFTRTGNKFNYGLVDFSNKKIIPLQYRDIHSIGSLRFAVQNFQNKTALFTENGKQVTDFSIDSISMFKAKYAVVYQNQFQGLLDRDGQIKVEPMYRLVAFHEGGVVTATQTDEWIFLDEKNQVQKKIFADSITPIDKNLYKIRNAGQIQLVDQDFKPIGNRTFTSLAEFKNGEALFKSGNKYGLIRKNGNIVFETKADRMMVNNNFFVADQRQSGKDQWFLLDSLGNRKHAKAYDQIAGWNGKFFPVRSRKYWGAIDGSGKEVIACVHDSLLQSYDEHVVVRFRGQYGIIDLQENWLVTPQPDMLELIGDDRYLQFSGHTVFLKSIDRQIIYFSNNKLEVKGGYLIEHLPSGATWQIDMHGVIVNRDLEPNTTIEKIFPESEGLRGIKKDGKFGFIDSRGRLRIANRYDNIQDFSETLAAIEINGKWGFINHEDKIAIQPAYEEVTPFKNGTAVVKQKGLMGLVGKNGKLILPARYQKLEVLPSRRIRLEQDGLFGLASAEGKMLLNTKYNSLDDLANGFVIVEREGKFSLLTLQGDSVIPMIYDAIRYDAVNNHYIVLKRAEWIKLDL